MSFRLPLAYMAAAGNWLTSGDDALTAIAGPIPGIITIEPICMGMGTCICG
jgi:hypothetical protein